MGGGVRPRRVHHLSKGPPLKPTVAVFDFDGTLTRRDTLAPFLLRACGRAATVRALAAGAAGLVGAVADDRGRDAAKADLLRRLLAGRALDELTAVAEEFAREVVARRLRPDTRALLARHREQGHRVVVVSASPELYVAPVGRRLGADAVLATRMEIGPAGRLTGALDGANCRGAEKVLRLRAHLGAEEVVTVGYGDSRGDRELLAFCDTARWVSRGPGGRRRPGR